VSECSAYVVAMSAGRRRTDVFVSRRRCRGHAALTSGRKAAAREVPTAQLVPLTGKHGRRRVVLLCGPKVLRRCIGIARLIDYRKSSPKLQSTAMLPFDTNLPSFSARRSMLPRPQHFQAPVGK